MSIEAEPKRSFWHELKRRNIYRVGIAFIVGGWLTLQFLDVVLPMIGAPDWIGRLVLVLLLLAFPIVIVLSWVYELTPDGIMRQRDVDLSKSITAHTGRRLDLAIVGLLILAVGWQAADRWLLPERVDTRPHRIAAPEEPSIAVLPFANMSADESSRHFSDGLADTLLHMLAQIRELRVAARTSSFQFRDTNNDVRTIASMLGVASVLEGSVQKAGNEIRVTAQLVDADTGFHLWSGIYERPFDDIFEIQDEIATHVVDALKVSLLGADAERLQRHATDNIDAYTAYLLGIDELAEFSFESLRRALEHFRTATSLDPDYTLAYVGIGRAVMRMADTGAITDEEMFATARPAVARALELDPELPDALVMKAVLDHFADEKEYVEDTLRKVIRRAPNNAFARHEYAVFLLIEGRFDEALAMLDEVMELDPLSLPALHTLSHTYHRLSQHEEALEVAARMRAINPRAPGGYYRAGFTEHDRGNWAAAITWMVDAAGVDPGDPELPIQIGDYYLDLYLVDEALLWYEHAMRVDPTHPMSESSMLVEPMLTGDAGTYVRLARELLVGDIDTRKGSRDVALEALALGGDASGDYSEFLTWVRRFEPGFFGEPPSVGERHTVLAARTARALIDSGDADTGARLAAAALAVQREADARDGIYWYSLVVAAAADEADAVAALLDDFGEAPWRVTGWNLMLPQPAWLAPYIDGPVYADVRDKHRAHAERQRNVLLEKNGGRFPLPPGQ